MVSMGSASGSTYHGEDGLERAIIDLVRVGARGHAAGVRQLASRLMRSLPTAVEDPGAFKQAVHEALVAARPTPGLRFDGGAIPSDSEGTHPLARVETDVFVDDVVFAPVVGAELDEIVAERMRADELAAAGVSLSRTVLFEGPPGVGKTMASKWLAQQLGLPLVTLDLAAVVSSFLGSSGRNIRAVLEYAKSGPCVLFLDEFDAVAKRRDDDSDIGELKRIVNVILVELDRWPETSLLVAATNHPQLLDSAIDRRFDRIIAFPLPDRDQRRALLASVNDDSVAAEAINLAAELWDGESSSSIVRFWEICRRKSVLRHTPLEEVLVEELVAHFPASTYRDMLWRYAHEAVGISNRRIATLAGVSHPTVATGIKRAKEPR